MNVTPLASTAITRSTANTRIIEHDGRIARSAPKVAKRQIQFVGSKLVCLMIPAKRQLP